MLSGEGGTSGKLCLEREEIGYMDGLDVAHGTATDELAIDWKGPVHWKRFDRSVRRHPPKHGTVDPQDHGVQGVAEPRCVQRDRVEHRLQVGRRGGDRPQNLGRRRLLLLRLNQLAVTRLELLPRLRQALLEVADPGAVALGGLAGSRGLGLLGLSGLWTPGHQPPLAYESAGDRLGECTRVSK